MKTKALVLAAAVLAAVVVLLAASCTTLPKRSIQAVMFEELESSAEGSDAEGAGAGGPGDGLPIVIETAEIVYDRGSDDAYPLTEILESTGRKEGLAIHTKGRWKGNDFNPYRLRLKAIEKKFTRDLSALYSVAVQAVLVHPEAERTVLEIIYHEESTASVESFYRLYSVIKAIMRKTARVIRKAQADRRRG